MQDMLKCIGPGKNQNILAQPVNSGKDQPVNSGKTNRFTVPPTGLQWGVRLKRGNEYSIPGSQVPGSSGPRVFPSSQVSGSWVPAFSEYPEFPCSRVPESPGPGFLGSQSVPGSALRFTLISMLLFVLTFILWCICIVMLRCMLRFHAKMCGDYHVVFSVFFGLILC